MTESEANELANDLRAINVDVREVSWDQGRDSWKLCCWCPNLARFYWVTDAKKFRKVVHQGLTLVLPQGALDKR